MQATDSSQFLGKRVVAPDGLWFGETEIRATVEFLERYFEADLLMASH